MKTFTLFKAITLALACAALAMTTTTRAEAGVIKAHAGTTFVLIPLEFDPNGNPTKLTHTVDGVIRVSSLGNCTVHFEVIAVPRPDGTFGAAGTWQITTADGNTTLNAEATAAVAPDPANPYFANFHYDVKFIGGTGQMANARGTADIDGFAMFTSASTGKATWLLEGNVETRGRRGRDN